MRRVLEEAASVDAFVHGLMSFLVELSEEQPGHPLIAALGEQLSRASTAPFAASAMHDLRSILQGVTVGLDYAPTLLDRRRLDDAQSPATAPTKLVDSQPDLLREAIEDARAGTRMAAELARETFEVYRGALVHEDAETAITRLNTTIATAVRLARRRAPIDLALETPDELDVRAGRNRLFRVLINLLSNAAHALDELEDPDDARIRVSSWASEEFAFVQIADEGPGIPAAVRASIFELFFTTHDEGSGIGLYVCKTLVEEWGGMIHVDSRDGEGASFTFSIPILDPVLG